MSLFLLILVIVGLYFLAAMFLGVVFVACVFWLQERRRRALEATARWHVPDCLPADWDLLREGS